MLLVHPSGRKQFVQRISIQGKRRDLGLGAYPTVSLGEARDLADENRLLVRKGLDPTAESVRTPTFAEAAEKVIELHSPSWTERGKSAAQWSSSLNTYAIPSLGHASVDAITTADVMAALEPIWNTKRVTAQRVRQRISTIMKWAIAKRYRPDDPAGEALVAALPKNGGQKVHHPAIPHEDVHEALAGIRASSGRLITKLAFEFLVLTAVRSGEVRLATWQEIDVENGLWTVPAAHTKDGKVHRIPLSSRALEILARVLELSPGSDLIFPSRRGTPMSDSTFSKMASRVGLQAVPHGFRFYISRLVRRDGRSDRGLGSEPLAFPGPVRRRRTLVRISLSDAGCPWRRGQTISLQARRRWRLPHRAGSAFRSRYLDLGLIGPSWTSRTAIQAASTALSAFEPLTSG